MEFQKFAAGNVGQMQSSLHQERLQRQEQAALCTKLDVDKQQMQHRCHDLEAKLRVQKHMMTRFYTQICCTGSVLMHTSYIQVAEVRATEAEEEQYRTEQELASARYGLHASHLHNQATISTAPGSGMMVDDLQTGSTRAESALVSSNAELKAANQRIHQLEQSAHGHMPLSNIHTNAQIYSNGLSTGMKGSHGTIPVGAFSDSNVSSHKVTAQAMEVNMCFLKLGFLLACPAAQHLQATCNSTHTLSRAWSARPAYCVIARMLPHSGCLVDTVSGKPMSDLACVFHPHRSAHAPYSWYDVDPLTCRLL